MVKAPTLNFIFDEVERALEHGHWFVALFVTLAIPDVCSALESQDGKATGPRYADWLDENVDHHGFSGHDVYKFRSSFLHQASTLPHPVGHQASYKRLLFWEPDPNRSHGLITKPDLVDIDAATFCDNVLTSARIWLGKMIATGNVNFQNNYKNIVQRYADGFPGAGYAMPGRHVWG